MTMPRPDPGYHPGYDSYRPPRPLRRDGVGSVVKWAWIGFNGVMLLFVLLPLIVVRALDAPSNTEVLAGFLGSALLAAGTFSFWFVTNLILGALTWMTRPG